MNDYGTRWTKQGQYNYAIYDRYERIEALGGSPIAMEPIIVWWYPGKETVGLGWTGDVDVSLVRLESELRPQVQPRGKR